MHNKKMKSIMLNIMIGLLILIGLGLILYPTIADKWNQAHQSRVISKYRETAAGMDMTEVINILDQARKYNTELLTKENRFMPSFEDSEIYNLILDTTGTGIMGYIEIPSINVKLPIYHGTDDSVLQIAVGHIEGSSLPIGGPDTHAAVSGHSGLPSAKLFTNIDKLSIGDVFYIHILSETLTYKVDQIEVVLPTDMALLNIIPGEDLFTLITCTPYGVNSHRLLVRGTRSLIDEIDNIE